MNEEDMGASADADRAATPSGPSPSVSGIAGIPSAVDRATLAAFFRWWSEDQRSIAYQKTDNDEHFEFYHRSQALADAARAIEEGDDLRFASGIEGEAEDAQRLHPEGESPARAEGEGDAQP